MKITENQLRSLVRKVINEQATSGFEDPEFKAARRRDRLNQMRRDQRAWAKQNEPERPTLPKLPSGKFTGSLGAWVDGVKVEFDSLPANVKGVVRLFETIDPAGDFMNKHIDVHGRRGTWKITKFGEQYGYKRSRGRPSGYSSDGGDYTMVDIPAESDEEVKIMWGIFAEIDSTGTIVVTGSAGPVNMYSDEHSVIYRGKRIDRQVITNWAKSELRSRGPGWQLEPYATKPSAQRTSAGSMGSW
jgi:hypothetical protein